MRSRFLLSFLVAFACGAEVPGDDPASCVPGEQRVCGCPGGDLTGAQICAEGGDHFGICFGCDPAGSTGEPTDGTDATSGTSGTSGTTGAASEDSGGSVGSSSSGPPPVEPLPRPDAYSVVEQVALEHPDWLLNSCVDMGGTNDFLFEVVRRLRQQDDRWGLNWKRGVIGDLSQDIVDYHYGDGVREESTDVYIIDVIVGHCGPKPEAAWIDVTQATLDADTVGMWTLAGQDL